jgi:hypothetical protein
MPDDAEAIALRIHQIAATVGMLAEGQARDAEPLSHALYLVEACLVEVEARVEGLRAGGDCPGIRAGGPPPPGR